jgi:NAD(P)-dependent dehydrogenase (short-subunit alcohol dehydrogenase family)
MNGKVCVVTGGTAGIGQATALGLARLGATVIIVGRNRERGEAALAQIKAASPTPSSAQAAFIQADLSSQREVCRLAAAICQQCPRLDVLINNAGLLSATRQLTEDGVELTLAVNHLAPFLLTNLLLDLLRGSAARIITVSSIVHRWGEIDFDDLMLGQRYSIDRAYNQSKLANVLFSHELARRLEGTSATSNCLAPGLVRTEFGDAYPGVGGWFARTIWLPLFAKPAEKGAETPVYLASSPDVSHMSGHYFADKKVVKPAAASRDHDAARRLWEVSARLTRLDDRRAALTDPAIQSGAR